MAVEEAEEAGGHAGPGGFVVFGPGFDADGEGFLGESCEFEGVDHAEGAFEEFGFEVAFAAAGEEEADFREACPGT